MTAEDGLRFVAYQASFAESCEQCEATLLLLPAILRVTNTPPMTGREALAFRRELLDELQRRPFEPFTLSEGRAA